MTARKPAAAADRIEAAQFAALAAKTDRRLAAARLAEAELAAETAARRTRAAVRAHRREEHRMVLTTAAVACVGFAVLLIRSAPWCTVALSAIAAVLLARVPQGGAEQ
jgi:hypothetical protein